ncbi:hypothetical protein KEF85_02720 [Methylomonas paludis]|uniref:Uncharacterized protein n=1 Tax=Methylomonas paludis TaxID=1173101 RepID=A0A975R9T8_9GAMM|nr:hypothetical protein [Methylomonas paludis]QWF71417.1 hypothetical protein KEF85_02720 [Methylomonas paludis]
MKKSLFLAIAMLVSGTAMAATDHYILRDGNHVQHLKITKVGNDISVSADVDFEPNAAETGRHPCSAQVSGEAKSTGENELVMKKHIEGEARSCLLKVRVSPNGAKVEQSEECGYFAAGICRFSSDGKELVKIQ